MSRRFLVLLQRATRIREMIDREQRSPTPSFTRLMRMKQLYLSLSRQLRLLIERRVVAMASAPRMRPDLVFGSVRATPALSRRW